MSGVDLPILTRVTHVGLSLSTTPDDAHVELAHLLLRLVPPPVRGEGQVGEHKVEGDEPAIEIVEELGEARVEGLTDFFALKRPRGGEDDEFGHLAEDLERLGGGAGSETELVLEELFGLRVHERGVGLEGFGGEPVLDLRAGRSAGSRRERRCVRKTSAL
jgi:hypothetical protein